MLKMHTKDNLIKTYYASTRKWRKIFRFTSFISAIVTAFLLLDLLEVITLFPEVNQTILVILLSIFSSLFLLATILYFFGISEKHYYRIILKEIVEHYAKQNDQTLTYEIERKALAPVHKAQGIFSKHLSVTDQCLIKGKWMGVAFTTYDTRMIQSTGQNSHQIFGGFYTVIDINPPSQLQIRSKSRPRKQEPKLEKIDSTHNLTLFLETKKQPTPQINKLLKQLQKYYEENDLKSVYLAWFQDKVHFAHEFKNVKRRFKLLTHESIDHIYKQFEKHMAMLEKVIEMSEKEDA